MESGTEHPLPAITKGELLFVQEGDVVEVKSDWQVRSENTIYAFFKTEQDANRYLLRILERRDKHGLEEGK